MFESVYIGLSGLVGFSKGLSTISNNVANLNTPGYKREELQFLDLFYQQQASGQQNPFSGSAQLGTGLGTGSTHTIFEQGELRQTGNDLDVAIEGRGFFVVRKDGETFYTRAGQFAFDRSGFLVDRADNARVAASNGGRLNDISINGLRVNPAKVTSAITFTDNLSSTDTQHVIDGITVFDASGGSHSIRLTFDNNNAVTAGSWNVTVSDTTGTIATGEIRFASGFPNPAFNSIAFTYAPPGTTAFAINLDFSNDVTSFSGGSDSTLQVNTQDGFATGALIETTFDSEGFLTATYSNGQTTKHDRLALATFDFEAGLILQGNNRFLAPDDVQAHIGTPGAGSPGQLRGGNIEISNVDLAQQFADLIITQRGYQGSSQVITAANEMIQQLFEIRGQR